MAAMVICGVTAALQAAAADFRFDQQDPGPADTRVPAIEPWTRIPLDPGLCRAVDRDGGRGRRWSG